MHMHVYTHTCMYLFLVPSSWVRMTLFLGQDVTSGSQLLSPEASVPQPGRGDVPVSLQHLGCGARMNLHISLPSASFCSIVRLQTKWQ